MYANDRDEINYHGFLKALRELNDVTLTQVAKGMCSNSLINRTENGTRVPEKLVRDRITSRLGVSGEKYEDYLQPEEYRQWVLRQKIVKAVEKKEIAVAEEALAEHALIQKLNCVQKQFAETMNFMLLHAKGAAKDELRDCINKAVAFTIPDIHAALAGEHLLADQELNLILEYFSLQEYDDEEQRVSDYREILAYMDDSFMENIAKAKVYPKVVCYICEILMKKDLETDELEDALGLCTNAVELLRDVSRLFYFVELLEYRTEILSRMLASEAFVERKAELEALLQKDKEWKQLFYELYPEYGVSIYMEDFCYLYWETECHNAVEVIEVRRHMLKLSRGALSEGVCADKTVLRLERNGVSPSMPVIRDLFEQMGMCAEYRRASVVTSDAEALRLVGEVNDKINKYEYEDGKAVLTTLENILSMDIAFNKQRIARWENIHENRCNGIAEKELYERAIEALEYTVPGFALFKHHKSIGRYITRGELDCIRDIAFQTHRDFSVLCLQIIEEMCMNVMDKDIQYAEVMKYEVLMSEMANYYGNCGEYTKSCIYSRKIIKEGLKNRRLVIVQENIYSIVWNYEKSINNDCMDIEYVQKNLLKCKVISEICRKEKWMKFFLDKINKIFTIED